MWRAVTAMRTILLPALLAPIHAATLSPCSSAHFEITEDGGTNFAAVVRVPRWQEGAKVQLVWGANAVSVRDESVSKSVKLTEQSSAAAARRAVPPRQDHLRAPRVEDARPRRRAEEARPRVVRRARAQAHVFPPLSLTPF